MYIITTFDSCLQPDFHKCLDKHLDNYEKTIQAWIEQRSYGFDLPLETLSENHPLCKYLKKEDEGLVVYTLFMDYQFQPTIPDLNDYKEVDVQAPIETDSMILSIDPQSGAINRLLDKNTSISS